VKCPTDRNNLHYIPLLHYQSSYPALQTRNDDDHDDDEDDNNNNDTLTVE